MQRRRLPSPENCIDLEALPGTALLTRAQVAEVSGFSQVALKKWAKEGRGPAIVRIEGLPRHRVRDVLAWINSTSKET